MGVYYIERRSHIIFDLKNGMGKRTAHALYLVDKVAARRERHSVVVNSMNYFVLGVTGKAHTRKYMHLIALTFQGARKFRSMSPYSSYGYRVKRLPCKYRYTHVTPSPS